MRYLNRIIFINSAKINYAEINVDGNVHFTGTQGVGKSTALRALLFFYNAKTTHLGIAPNQKIFQEFYLEKANSYIVYEVVRETGTYCVFVFKSRGRIIYRFFDSAYSKSYFIDNEGFSYEPDKIRLALGDINLTKQIDSYEDFRNIIYGNSQAIEPQFRKYSIVESKQYQNIPRTIQNVFLNSKLEAEFIKETIIMSLSEESFSFTLDKYNNHLRDFKENLSDLEKWSLKNRNGEVEVRIQAQKVVDSHIKIKNIEGNKDELARQIGWALHDVKMLKPQKTTQLTEQEAKKEKLDKELSELGTKFNKQKDILISDIGGLKSKLQDATNKRKEYDFLDINLIIERVSKKINWDNEKTALSEEKALLTSKFQDVKAKYDTLLQQADNQLSEFKNQKVAEKNKEITKFQEFRSILNQQYEVIFKEIKDLNQEQANVLNEHLENIKAELHNVHLKQVGANLQRFYEKEIGEAGTELARLNSENTANNQSIEHYNLLNTGIQKEWDLSKTALEEEQRRKVEAQNALILTYRGDIKAIQDKLENTQNSFYGWLNENTDNWENNIGKIINDGVLFQSDLTPKPTSKEQNSLYGIEINLSKITTKVKTEADYQLEIKDKESKITLIRKEISDSMGQLQEEIEKLRQKHQPKINENKTLTEKAKYTIEQNVTKKEQAQIKLDEFKNKAIREKKELLEKLDNDKITTETNKVKAEGDIANLKAQINTEIEARKKEKNLKETNEQKLLNSISAKIDAEIKQKQDEISQRKNEIKDQQNKELSNEGADTDRISKIDKRLIVVENELNFIENNRTKVTDFEKDKRELFDKVDEFKRKKEQFEIKQQNAQNRFNDDKQKLEVKIKTFTDAIDSIKADLVNIQTDLNEYEKFKEMSDFGEIEALTHISDANFKTDKSCKDLIADFIERNYAGKDENQNLQSYITKFNGNFSSTNTFKFKINLTEKKEFLQFAIDLKEFLDTDKIVTYQERVTGHFTSIIRGLSVDITELLSRRNEIDKIIGEINKDFIDRMFTGVIKSIELKTEESRNEIITLLLEIKKFNEENQYELGELNLFSQNNQANTNKKAVEYLSQLDKAITGYEKKEILLSDTFDLYFRVKENDNDTGWVTNLSKVGSDGTDVLVKAMINIMLLNVFKNRASKNNSQEFKLHCMMDEIGKLHSNNVDGILKFATARNIYLLNSSPESLNNVLSYKYTYKLAKDDRSATVVKRIITNNRDNA